MKFNTAMRWVTGFFMACLLAAPVSGHAGEKKEKQKPSSAVDSGSFGVFVGGQRVLTEDFIIEQKDGVSAIKAELKEPAGKDPAIQKSELEITPSGELVRYDWSQSSGGSVTILPNNEFLIEKISASASAKPAEQPFLMPNTSMILDNNFFVHREVLVWRYLAADCKVEGSNLKCKQGPAEFGVVIPQDHTSVRVRLELVGKEKVTFHGAERELLRLNLTGEGFQWTLWVDDLNQFKLMRVSIPADNTEVVRD